MCASEKTVLIDGFTVIQTKFQESGKTGHSLYVKEAHSRGISRPKDRTLFVVNVPPYCTQASIRSVFSTFGDVTKVYLYDRPQSEDPPSTQSTYFPDRPKPKVLLYLVTLPFPSFIIPTSTSPFMWEECMLSGVQSPVLMNSVMGFKVAYIIFKKAASLGKVTSHSYDKVLRLSPEENPILTGIKKWQMEYEQNVCNPKALQAEVDNYMTQYDEEQEREKRLALEQEGVPDEDGWVTVTRHGKNKGAPRTETMEKKVTTKNKKKQAEKELKNFYAFQMRESKRDKIAELRKKFEEDKQRISLMKASRKFRPY